MHRNPAHVILMYRRSFGRSHRRYAESQRVAGPLGETSQFIGLSTHIQQPAAAKLYRESYTQLLDAAAIWLQPLVMNFDVSPYRKPSQVSLKKLQQSGQPATHDVIV